jgi:lipopolysaccharide export LptBFGC system permease protein LptF
MAFSTNRTVRFGLVVTGFVVIVVGLVVALVGTMAMGTQDISAAVVLIGLIAAGLGAWLALSQLRRGRQIRH